MIAIIDYDAGNLKNVYKALRYIGEEAVITRDIGEIESADRIILPGVGNFGDAMEKLARYNLIEPIKAAAAGNKPILGICLGLQIMFHCSEESDGVDGLGILSGKIRRIPYAPGLKIPHIGWNSLEFRKKGRLFAGIESGEYVYFVHSYYLDADDKRIVTAVTNYSTNIDASVERDNIFACQFHPEKSGEAGLKILRNFASL